MNAGKGDKASNCFIKKAAEKNKIGIAPFRGLFFMVTKPSNDFMIAGLVSKI